MHLSLMISRRYINRLKLSLMHISLLAGIPEEFKVNIYIGWLFKLIPLIMGLICIALGGFVLESSGQSEYFVAVSGGSGSSSPPTQRHLLSAQHVVSHSAAYDTI